MIARRGVALIVVLWAILLLATVTAAASSAARGSADVTSSIRAASIASAMAESGILASSTRLERTLTEFQGDSLARDAWLATVAAGSAEARDADILRARDSLVASLLGRPIDASNGPAARRAIESLDELADIPGVDVVLIERVAELLTVDGDGNVNRSAAPRSVLAAASGSLVDRPTRLLVISRGWMRGSSLTRQIEAVYDLSGDELRLVRWREHER